MLLVKFSLVLGGIGRNVLGGGKSYFGLEIFIVNLEFVIYRYFVFGF